MPIYNFVNKETQEITEHSCKISELDQYKADNPHLEQCHITAPSIGDPVQLGVRRLDNGFREVLQNIHRNTPGSVLGGNIR